MQPPQVIGKSPKPTHFLAAALMHLSLLPSAFPEKGLFAWALPLLLWLLLRSWSPLIDHHGQRAINLGVWLAIISGILQVLVMSDLADAQGVRIVWIAVMICWAMIVLRRSIKAWQGKEIVQRKFSWVG